MLNGLGCFPFARHYSGNHYCFLFHQVLRCFSSPGWLFSLYGFKWEFPDITLEGLSHSEIRGYSVASTSPRRIVGSHVLHRLFVPRHPPYALSNLAKKLYYKIDAKIKYEIVFMTCCKLSVIIYLSFNLSKNLKNFSVELNGIEPLTSALQGRRSPNWAIAPEFLLGGS